MNSKVIEAFLINGYAYSIVKVLALFTVYRHHLHISKISSSKHIRFTDFISCTHSLIHYSFRELTWNLISFDNSQDVHARVIDITYDLSDFAFRILAGYTVTIISDLYYDFIS